MRKVEQGIHHLTRAACRGTILGAGAAPSAATATTANKLEMSTAASSSSASTAVTDAPATAAAQSSEAEATDAFTDGLMGLLSPLVHKCDEGVQQALDSQAALSEQIDRVRTHSPHMLQPLSLLQTHPRQNARSSRQVAAELQKFLGSSQLPSFAPQAQKLQNVRRRVATCNATLQQVKARLARLDQLAERLQAQEQVALDQAGARGDLQ